MCKIYFWKVYIYSNENTFELLLLLAVNLYIKCINKYLLPKRNINQGTATQILHTSKHGPGVTENEDFNERLRTQENAYHIILS